MIWKHKTHRIPLVVCIHKIHSMQKKQVTSARGRASDHLSWLVIVILMTHLAVFSCQISRCSAQKGWRNVRCVYQFLEPHPIMTMSMACWQLKKLSKAVDDQTYKYHNYIICKSMRFFYSRWAKRRNNLSMHESILCISDELFPSSGASSSRRGGTAYKKASDAIQWFSTMYKKKQQQQRQQQKQQQKQQDVHRPGEMKPSSLKY